MGFSTIPSMNKSVDDIPAKAGQQHRPSRRAKTTSPEQPVKTAPHYGFPDEETKIRCREVIKLVVDLLTYTTELGHDLEILRRFLVQARDLAEHELHAFFAHYAFDSPNEFQKNNGNPSKTFAGANSAEKAAEKKTTIPYQSWQNVARAYDFKLHFHGDVKSYENFHTYLVSQSEPYYQVERGYMWGGGQYDHQYVSSLDHVSSAFWKLIRGFCRLEMGDVQRVYRWRSLW